MDNLLSSNSLSADTPKSRPSGSDRPPQDRGQIHIPGRVLQWRANRRTARRSRLYNHPIRGKPACSRGVRKHDRNRPFPNLLQASSAASKCDAHRTEAKIAAWMPWPRFYPSLSTPGLRPQKRGNPKRDAPHRLKIEAAPQSLYLLDQHQRGTNGEALLR